MTPRTISILGATCKWTGRALSLALLILWGMFFVEHMKEWFLRPDGRYPPAWVFRQQAFHFLIIVGLGIMLRWDRVGTLVMALATIGFFALIPGWQWGGRGWFMPFINLVPVVFFAVYWLTRRGAAAPAQP
ncbi:MAG: hypothetical protein ACLQBJ_07155 [Bryobacteraceae bacterium]